MASKLTEQELNDLFQAANKAIDEAEKKKVSQRMGQLAADLKEGKKADEGKAPMDLLPPELLLGISQVLDFGAKKYAARNWEKGIRWGRVFAALMRHMWAWWSGEERDAETGFSHLWHAGCCIAFLIAYEQRQIGEDDRPKGVKDAGK